MARTTRKIVVTVAAVALVGAAGVGTSQASPPVTGIGAPSACRPANHTARITAGPTGNGHRHYRVTLTAAPGYDPCELAGSPTDVRFHHRGSLDGVTAGRYGPQRAVVRFGPGRPAHFDIRVPNSAGGAPADETTFTLRTPDGVIPGESTADGRLTVDAGTAIGPIRPGA